MIEAKFVDRYRSKLLRKCRGAAYMRLELHDFFVTIARSNAVDKPAHDEDGRRVSERKRSKSAKSGNDPNEPKQGELVQTTLKKPNKAISKSEWFFADLIEVNLEAVDNTEADCVKLGKELIESRTRTDNRKTDPMFRVVDSVVKCPYVGCEDKDVPAGTMESVGFLFVQGLTRVRHSLPSSHFP